MATKQQASNNIAIAVCAMIFTSLVVLALYQVRQGSAPLPPPPAHKSMSDVDIIKQKIREAESLRDAAEKAAETASGQRDFEKSSEWARKQAEQQAIINDLYDQLHEANLKEGEGNKESEPGNGNK